MNEFAYENGILTADGVSLAEIAETVGTPVYCYSTAALEQAYRDYADAFAAIPSLAGRRSSSQRVQDSPPSREYSGRMSTQSLSRSAKR